MAAAWDGRGGDDAQRAFHTALKEYAAFTHPGIELPDYPTGLPEADEEYRALQSHTLVGATDDWDNTPDQATGSLKPRIDPFREDTDLPWYLEDFLNAAAHGIDRLPPGPGGADTI